jgi:hypothetical protein
VLDHSCQVQRHALAKRGDDLYETPDVAVDALLRVEKVPHRVWEPACGPGAIVRVLRAHGHDVFASDLVDYGDPTHFYRRDFLMELAPPPGYGGCALTNPPFKLVEEFVAHAIDLCPLVIMLLRLAFFEGGAGRTRKAQLRRYALDEHPPARIHVFRLRLPMMHRARWTGEKANSGMAFGWFAWDRSHTGPTTIDRISWEAAQPPRALEPAPCSDGWPDLPDFLRRSTP